MLSLRRIDEFMYLTTYIAKHPYHPFDITTEKFAILTSIICVISIIISFTHKPFQTELGPSDIFSDVRPRPYTNPTTILRHHYKSQTLLKTNGEWGIEICSQSPNNNFESPKKVSKRIAIETRFKHMGNEFAIDHPHLINIYMNRYKDFMSINLMGSHGKRILEEIVRIELNLD